MTVFENMLRRWNKPHTNEETTKYVSTYVSKSRNLANNWYTKFNVAYSDIISETVEKNVNVRSNSENELDKRTFRTMWAHGNKTTTKFTKILPGPMRVSVKYLMNTIWVFAIIFYIFSTAFNLYQKSILAWMMTHKAHIGGCILAMGFVIAIMPHNHHKYDAFGPLAQPYDLARECMAVTRMDFDDVNRNNDRMNTISQMVKLMETDPTKECVSAAHVNSQACIIGIRQVLKI